MMPRLPNETRAASNRSACWVREAVTIEPLASSRFSDVTSVDSEPVRPVPCVPVEIAPAMLQSVLQSERNAQSTPLLVSVTLVDEHQPLLGQRVVERVDANASFDRHTSFA